MAAVKYLAVFASAFRSRLVYRTATIANIVSAALGLAVQLGLWSALLAGGYRPDTTLPQMMAYVLINTVLMTLTRSGFADEMGASIQDGSVVMHFIRPASFQGMMLASMLGGNAYQALAAGVPVILLSALVVGVPLPPSVAHLGLFLAHATVGVLLTFQLIFLVGLLAFWTQATWFLSWYLRAGITFFGGTAVPLWFYPEALSRLNAYLPFRYITAEAVGCYLGRRTPGEAGLSLLIALAWLLALFAAGKWLWGCVTRKMTINGG